MGPDVATLPSPGPGTPGPAWRRRRRVALVVVLGVVAPAVLGLRRLRRVEVTGGSMAPALLPGDRLLVRNRPTRRTWSPAVGDVVAVCDPREPGRILVKRVAAVDRAARTLDIRGDDPGASTDSRHFGPVPVASVLGRAVYRYAPVERTGPGPWRTGYDRS